MLCSGPCFEITMFAEEGEVYKLLDLLLASEDSKIYQENKLINNRPDITICKLYNLVELELF